METKRLPEGIQREGFVEEFLADMWRWTIT